MAAATAASRATLPTVSDELGFRANEPRSIRGTVLSMLRDSGPLSRIEIARRSGLSATTITRTVNQLVDASIVAEGGVVSGTRLGRPATEIGLNAESAFVVGAQVGVGTVQLGLIDVLGQTHSTASFEYEVGLPADAVFTEVAGRIGDMISASGVDRRLVLGVGIAVPGPVDADRRRMLLTINLPWRDVPVADLLERILGLPVVVEHNVRSMAVAEARFGSGRGHGSVAFVYLRTGIGAGLVVEGQPFAGGVHGAIELGHLRVVDADERCVCGNTGCLETVVSDSALRARARELGLQDASSPLSVIWAAAATDQRASEVIDRILGAVANGLASLVNLLNPELILLGGVLATMPPEFLDRLTQSTLRGVFPVIRDSVQIQPSSLGMEAGVLGGATVALDALFYA